MTLYRYYGRDQHGEAIHGEIDKNDHASVLNYLQQQQIIPIKIDTFKPSPIANYWNKIKNTLFRKKVSDEDLIMFCRQMYTITKAGVPIAQGMNSLSETMNAGVLQDALVQIVERLQAGVELSTAMKVHDHIFDKLFVSMVQVGENSGNLDAVFLQLSHYIERDFETRKSIKSATRYPSFVIIAMVLAMIVVNLFVIPAFSDMFSRFDADLPIATVILLAVSDAFVHYWWLMLVASITLFVALVIFLKTPQGKLSWSRYKLHLPLIGHLINKASLARYTRSFSVMLKAGVPLADAIGLCAKVIDNAFLDQRIQEIKQGVERGESLKKTHSRSNVFTPLILQMIGVGEQSGQVDTLLLDVAEYYEREVDYDLKSLSAKIEPLLIVIMAIFVLVLALGIFLPMWELFNVQQ
jgi:MSHA biogenesis protein MshG